MEAFFISLKFAYTLLMAVVKNEYDVIVIGAGVSGLMAALELSKTGKKVIIAEATNRIGGRVFTLKDDINGRPIELGAEFVHGELDLTQKLIKSAKGQLIKAGGELWRHRDGKLESQDDFIEDYSVLKKKYKELEHDIPISHFLEQKLSGDQHRNARESIKDYVEGYYAANISRSSTSALIKEWEESESSQYRINAGYDIIIQYLRLELEKKGCFIQLLSPVSHIHWEKNFVEVKTNKDIIKGRKVLITVSLGVLQSSQLVFNPAIPDKINAAHALGYGGAFKLVFHFDNYFWKEHKEKDLSKMSFLFSEETIPTWWTQVPADVPIITGWLAGPKTKQLEHSRDDKILEEGLRSLGNIFEKDVDYLYAHLKNIWIKNWQADPYYLGAYAYEVVEGEKYKKILSDPVDNSLFFAGEALSEKSETGTVEAALESGRNMAYKIIASV